jgi:hypothetical protein
LLSLTGGASAENVDLAKDTSTENAAAHHEITLEEEEISDVSLGTFYLFDKEDAGTHHPGIQLARGCRGCGSAGCQARTKWLASIFQLPAASLLRSAEIAAAHFRTPLEAGEKSLFR